jgi:hypothetical protein
MAHAMEETVRRGIRGDAAIMLLVAWVAAGPVAAADPADVQFAVSGDDAAAGSMPSGIAPARPGACPSSHGTGNAALATGLESAHEPPKFARWLGGSGSPDSRSCTGQRETSSAYTGW